MSEANDANFWLQFITLTTGQFVFYIPFAFRNAQVLKQLTAIANLQYPLVYIPLLRYFVCMIIYSISVIMRMLASHKYSL